MKKLSVFTTKIVQSNWFKDDVFAFEFLKRIFPRLCFEGKGGRGSDLIMVYNLGI